jgi:la-related protein 1
MTTPSTTSTSSTTTTEMATPSAFSYAQAAKGQNTVPSSTAAPANPAEATASAPAVDKASAAAESSAEIPDSAPPAASEKPEVESVPESEGDAPSESIPERPSEPRRDDDSERLNRPWRRNDKGTRSSSATTQSLDEQDSRKARRGKKSKSAEKQSGEQTPDKEQEAEPEPPKIELSEAPIPSVNIWHQRKEAQQAKGPVSTSQQAANGVSDNGSESSKPARSAEDAAAGPRDGAAQNGVKPSRKSGDSVRPERNGSRGSRVADKDIKDTKSEVPPPVADAGSWPTPETAIKEDKKKTVEKVDRPEKEAQDDASGKPRQKEKWVTYDYVPSVSFETQLPQLRGSKPRGGARGASGARTASGGQPAEKASVPANKLSDAKDKPRETANGTNGAAPASQQSKRASMDVSNIRDRKSANHAGSEKTKETAAAHAAEQGQNTRERPEGRGERGRGGYRGRGGHHSVNSHSQHQPANAGPGFASASGMGARGQGHYSPPGRQGSHGQGFMPPSQRGGRGGRNGNGNFHRMSLPNGASRPPPVQTQFNPYDYPMPPMSAMAFPAQWEMLFPVMKAQIEYYFSIENMCKDWWLRKHMDSQGFVPLHFIAAFARMRQLSTDMALIRAVCEESNEVDFVVSDDNTELLRRRKDWVTFVYPMEEREELARNPGPAQFSYRSRSYLNYAPQYNGAPGMPYGMQSPPAFYPSGEQPFQPFPDEQHGGPVTNGMVNGHGPATQLSADVPDFSPSGPGAFAQQGHGDAAHTKSNLHPEASPVVPNGHAATEAANGLTNGVHQEGQEATQS